MPTLSRIFGFFRFDQRLCDNVEFETYHVKIIALDIFVELNKSNK